MVALETRDRIKGPLFGNAESQPCPCPLLEDGAVLSAPSATPVLPKAKISDIYNKVVVTAPHPSITKQHAEARKGDDPTDASSSLRSAPKRTRSHREILNMRFHYDFESHSFGS